MLGGFTDFVLPSTYSGAHGAITGLANIAPVRVMLISLPSSFFVPLFLLYPRHEMMLTHSSEPLHWFFLPRHSPTGQSLYPHVTLPAQYATVHLFNLSVRALAEPSILPEAQRVQGIVARADATIAKAGISGTKYLLEQLYGYGGLPRRPLGPCPPERAEALWAHSDVRELVALERQSSGKAV